MVDISRISQENPIKAQRRMALAQREQAEQVSDEIRRAKAQMVDVKLFQGEAQRIQDARKGGRIRLGW